jgi:hypothetical protein
MRYIENFIQMIERLKRWVEHQARFTRKSRDNFLRTLKLWTREITRPRRTVSVAGHRVHLLQPRRQWTTYSCAASVTQMAYGFVTGKRMGHRKAIDLTKCRPNGATLDKVAAVLKRKTKCVARDLPRRHSSLKSALSKGSVLLAGDSKTYDDEHAIIILGFSPRGYWLVDPAVGVFTWRNKKRVMTASDQFIAVAKN